MGKIGKKTERKHRTTVRSSSDWREGTVQEFLGLSDEVAQLISTKAALAVLLQRSRKAKQWSQATLAEKIGSGQSRVAKMEAAHPSVSLDLLIKALLTTGVTMRQIAAVMASTDPSPGSRVRPAKKTSVKRGRKGVWSVP
ncbi:MAG: helix-turn-helix domain-containing protein [Gemmatimonadota bacterium]|nr:MAG: helix-turn-helix domain-containing protein [Gemmatimonadota bacterium]